MATLFLFILNSNFFFHFAKKKNETCSKLTRGYVLELVLDWPKKNNGSSKTN